MSYNAILCAIVLTGKRWLDFLWITIATLLAKIINIGMVSSGMVTVIDPFCFNDLGHFATKAESLCSGKEKLNSYYSHFFLNTKLAF